MNKKEEFKQFIKTKPELVDYVKTGEMTWQSFYEVYDIYGNDKSVWSKYGAKSSTTNESVSSISDLMKGVNMDSIQEHIGTAQRALGFVQELATSGKTSVIKPKGPTTARPINKFFGD